jgi:hypothetical protein
MGVLCLWFKLTYIPSGISIGVEWLDHMAVPFLDFEATP